MKIAFCYNAWDNSAFDYHERFVAVGKKMGIDVFPVVATPNAPRPRMSFNELDKAVLFRSRKISQYRDSLIEQIKEADVFWLFNGANFHPSWVRLLPDKQLKIFGFHDDPESSFDVALPVAPYFDACLISNSSAIPYYQGHARRITEWLPLFITEDEQLLTDKDFSTEKRPIGLVFCGERTSPWRKERLDIIRDNFPDGQYWGKGWPNGYATKISELYKRSKLGINIHNSTGPINIRMNELPAFGVMQICDNKCRFGHIYKLNSEAVGFDYIDEAVDLLKYYLDPAHDEERAQIAWNGYQRYRKEYTMGKIWDSALEKFEKWQKDKEIGQITTPKYSRNPFTKTVKHFLRPFLKNKIASLKAEIIQQKRGEYGVPPHQVNNFDHSKAIPASLKKKLLPPLQIRAELGPINLQVRDEIITECGFFEYPNMIALNWAVAALVGDAKKILEIGSGTGAFAYEAAQDPTRTVLALEYENGAREWAIQHRSLPNIQYENISLENLTQQFDLIVSIDVIEHIESYQKILQECARLSPRAIFSTPNRLRNSPPRLLPEYDQHVQEWGAEGFYYTLKAYYKNVFLLSMPDYYTPLTVPIDINSKMTPLIAVCEN